VTVRAGHPVEKWAVNSNLKTANWTNSVIYHRCQTVSIFVSLTVSALIKLVVDVNKTASQIQGFTALLAQIFTAYNHLREARFLTSELTTPISSA
jgi:hypothetical protein